MNYGAVGRLGQINDFNRSIMAVDEGLRFNGTEKRLFENVDGVSLLRG